MPSSSGSGSGSAGGAGGGAGPHQSWSRVFRLLRDLGKKYTETIAATIPVVTEPVVQEEVIPEPIKAEPMDDDKDGVLNKFDKCPNTSAGVKVNKDGCFEVVNLNINFDNDSVQIKDQYMKNYLSYPCKK